MGANSYYIVYQYDRESTPEFTEQLISCSSGNSLCAYFGYPVNWIIEYPTAAATFSSSVTSTFTATTGIYSGTYDGLVRAFGNTGLTIYKATFDIVYTSRAITSASFVMSGTYMYKGV